MIGLSDSQLEIIMSTAEPMAEDKCKEFLASVAEAVAPALQVRGQITDDDVSIAVQLALRALISNSTVWNEVKRRQNGHELDAPLVRSHSASTKWRTWRLLSVWFTKIPRLATRLDALGLLPWRRKSVADAQRVDGDALI